MNYYIGIDLGGTNVRIAKVDEDGKIVQDMIEPSHGKEGPEKIETNILEMLKEFDLKDVKSIGFAIPGPVDAQKNVITQATNIPGCENYPFADNIEKVTGIPVFLDNDANAAGLAEALLGSGKGYDIVYFITHSTGIGGGLIINKRVVSGRKGFGGEVANVFVKANGIKKNNLIAGAVENEASGTALALKAKELISDDIKDAEDVFNLIRNNKSEIADELVEDMSKSIAILLSDIAAIIAPDCFVIGGGCSNASELYFHRIEKYFKEYCHDYNNDTPIFKANIKEPGVIGASLLAKR